MTKNEKTLLDALRQYGDMVPEDVSNAARAVLSDLGRLQGAIAWASNEGAVKVVAAARNEALEEAAQACARYDDTADANSKRLHAAFAARVRALKSQPAPERKP